MGASGRGEAVRDGAGACDAAAVRRLRRGERLSSARAVDAGRLELAPVEPGGTSGILAPRGSGPMVAARLRSLAAARAPPAGAARELVRGAGVLSLGRSPAARRGRVGTGCRG